MLSTRRAFLISRMGRPDVRFALSIVVPAVVILVVTFSALVVALNEIAREVDRTALSLTNQTVEAAVEATLRHMADTHGDYAIWDDAARKLYGKVDQRFVDDSFVSSTADPIFFDTVYLLDADGTTVFAYRDGEAVAMPPEQAFGPSLRRLLRATADASTPDARSALVSGVWGPMVVAVGPVVPFSHDIPTPDPKRILVLAKSLNAESVKRLSTDYLIKGLTLAPPTVAVGRNALALTDADGRTIATLTWDEQLPGSAALTRLNPRVIGVLVVLALTVLVLIAIAARGFARVRRGEVLARHAATHDSLSGLPNRAALLEHLGRAIDQHRGDANLAIACVELKAIDEVNDAYGRDVGDQLLRKVAQGFRTLAGKCYLVRVGGDEFAVVIDKPGVADRANELGERLARFFAKPFDVGGRIIPVSANVGIAFADDAGVSAHELLRRGEVAMYQARQEGRNRVCVFDGSIDVLRRKRLEISGELRRALAVEGLVLFYQPVCNATDGSIVSAEALIRWPRGDDVKPISPAEFIPIAEETGLIDELGMWTLRRACRDAATWPGLKVSVNVSPAQFPNPNFADAVAGVLKETGFPAERLEIEVTETYLVTHPEQARRVIDSIRALGITVALDEFGVG
jgi:diguanylate cyclase (GGDEF)-like protein